MTRNLKLIVAAAMASLAMTAVFASAASADVITAESTPATLTGVQGSTQDEFTVHAGKVKCAVVKYTGTLTTNGGTTVQVKPTYSNCTFVGLAATVSTGTCEYLVHVNSGAGNTTGTVDIVNCGGGEITVTAPSVGTPKCIVHVKEQFNLGPGSVSVVGSGTTRELHLSIGITNIAYSQTAGTAASGNCTTADSTTGGSYTGTALITGENAAGTTHIGLFLS